jgi:hypothetical protein
MDTPRPAPQAFISPDPLPAHPSVPLGEQIRQALVRDGVDVEGLLPREREAVELLGALQLVMRALAADLRIARRTADRVTYERNEAQAECDRRRQAAACAYDATYCQRCEDRKALSLARLELDDVTADRNAATRAYNQLRSACDTHMQNIRTWMQPGFKSHCTDAMMIMGSRVDDMRERAERAEADRDAAVKEAHSRNAAAEYFRSGAEEVRAEMKRVEAERDAARTALTKLRAILALCEEAVDIATMRDLVQNGWRIVFEALAPAADDSPRATDVG